MPGNQNIRFNKGEKKKGIEYIREKKISETQINIQWKEILSNRKRSKSEVDNKLATRLKYDLTTTTKSSSNAFHIFKCIVLGTHNFHMAVLDYLECNMPLKKPCNESN